jgi:acyl-coenzyme A synthetase/AMP-(fatty) acid ligase
MLDGDWSSDVCSSDLIEFIAALPMTTTGKVQRRVLRLQEEARFRPAT